MNRVYKVIWSKAKHCYVVTSEIAKGYGKSAGSKGVKALLSGLVALSIAMGGYGLAGAVYVDSRAEKDGAYTTEVYTKLETNDNFATKAELNAKANAADVENTYAKTADVESTYVKNDDAKVGAEVTYVNAANTVGENLSALDKYVTKNTEAVLKVATQVGENSTALGKLDKQVKDNLKVGVDGVISKVTGDDSTPSSPVNKLVLNVDGNNRITMDGNGIKVGTNSTVIASDGVFAGGDTAADAKAALNADGSIKGAEGKFTVGTDGKVTAASGKIGTVDITSDGALTGMKSLGVENINAGGTITGNKLTDGVASLQAGNLNVHDIVATGDISGKAISGTTITGTTITGTSLNTKGGDISGGAITGTTITGTSLNTQNGEINGGDIKSSGAIEGNSLTLKGGKLDAGSGTITTTGDINGNNINTTGKITTKDLEVTGGLKTDHITLGSEDLNQTDINKGKVTSKIHEISGAVEYTAESIFNKDGSSITVRTNEGRRVDSTGSSTVGSQIITQYLGNNAVPGGNNVTRKMIRNNDGTFSMEDKAVYDGKSSTVSQNAKEGIVSETNGGAGSKVTLTQGMNGTYKVETSGTSTEEISGQKIENYKGGLDTNITGNETHDVSGNMTTTVTGDSSLTAENITNEAKNKITNKAIDVETDATSSIVQKVTNDAGSNTSTQWSYQTKEEMSQTDGKTASYLRGAVEEKSELIDGDVKTTIDTIAGQTNTNITDGTNTSNDLQKADQIASSVTDGTNTTVVNQNAGSLASSITDGTKVNNTKNTVDKSEQLIKVDDTHLYAEIRTAETAVETLKSGKTQINIVKDTNTPTVSSAVFDGATITGISQNAKDISLSAAGGTITNDAKDVLNKGTNSVINEVDANQVAVMTDSVKAAYGSDTYTTWDDKGITNNAKDKTVATNAKDLVNTASNSITDKVGENVERTMGTKKIEESVKDGTKSNTFTKTAKKDMNIITDGTKISTESQLADSVNTSLEEVDGAGKTTKSLNNVKTVSEDTTKMTDAASGAFSKRSQTVSQIQDKVGKTTVTTTDGLTKLTDEDHNHTTEMDYAHVTKDLSVERDTTLGKEGEHTNLTVNSKSEFKDTVKMDSTLEVDRTSKFNDKVTITQNGLAVTGGTTTDTLKVEKTSEFGGKAAFKDDVSMGKNLSVGGNLNVDGNIETHDAVLSADSRQVVTGRQLYQTNERVDRLDNRIKKVGANAAALAALRPGDFNPDDKFSIAAGFGSYRNANAAALGLFYRPNENVLLSLGTSFGDGENMVNAGVSVKFGRGKSMAERRKEMADEVSSMRDEMRSQDERIAELEEMLKKQSELIEKLSKES